MNGVFVAIITPNLTIKYMNSHARQLLGFSTRAIFSKDWLKKNVTPKERRQLENTVKSLVEHKILQAQVQFHIKTNNNCPVSVEMSCELYPCKKGQIPRVIGTGVIGKKLSAESVSQNVDTYYDIFNFANDMIFIHDIKTGAIIDVNEQVCDTLEYSKEELLQLSVEDISSGESPFTQKEAIRKIRLAANNSPQLFEWRCKTKRGVLIWVEVNLKKIMFRGSLCMMAIVRDITYRKTVEELLQKNERRVKTLLSNLQGMVYRCRNDPDWTMEFVSEGSFLLTGYTPQELEKNNVISYGDLILPEFREYVWNEVQAAVGKKLPFRLEYKIEKADGSQCWVWEKGRGVFSSSGKLEALEGFILDITERKEIEANLYESEQRYLNIIKTSPDAIILADFKGNLLMCNEQAARLHGFSNEKEMITKIQNIFQLAIPKERARVKTNIKEIFQQGSTHNVEYELLKSDGSHFIAEISASVIYDEEGIPRAFLEIARDVTFRKTSELALKSSEEKYRTLVDNALVGIYQTNLNGDIIYINHAFARIFEFDTPCDMMKEGVLLRYKKPGDRKKFLQLLKKKKRIGQFEIEVLTRTGKVKNVLLSATLHGDQVSGMLMDITSIIQAELALREERDFNKSIIQSSPAFFVIMDAQGKVLSMNDSLLYSLGRTIEEVEGKDFISTFVSSQDHKVSRMILRKIVRQRNSVVYESRILNRDNTIIFVEWHSQPILRRTSRLECFFMVGIDITERKKAEQVLRRDKAVFEKLVQEKTAALVQTQQELEKSRRLSDIGMLAATVAHELRNPLAAIRFALFNIGQKRQNIAIDKHLANIEKKITESNQIIDNLLFYSRLKMPHHERVCIKSLLEECINSALKRYYTKTVDIYKNFTHKVCVCEVDPLQIRELFDNILNNAFDALGDRNGKIVIRVQVSHYRKECVVVSISDNGTGIKSADLSQIYQPFFTTKAKGTGLGLTVCQQIVTLHNGSIDIKSKKNKGTRIKVVLPVEKMAS